MSVAEILINNKRKIERLERKAAEKAGMRFLFFDDAKLFVKDKDKYIENFIERLIEDLMPEILMAARLGKETYEAIKKRAA